MTSNPVNPEHERIKRLYRDVFSGPMGREVLADILRHALITTPAFHPGHEPVALAHQRGIRDLALQIAKRAGVTDADIARALTGVLPHQPEKEPDHGHAD